MYASLLVGWTAPFSRKNTCAACVPRFLFNLYPPLRTLPPVFLSPFYWKCGDQGQWRAAVQLVDDMLAEGLQVNSHR